MTGHSFRCMVVTPEAVMVDVQVTSAVFCAHDGLTGVLPGHAPFLSKLGTGIVRYRDVENNNNDKGETVVFIHGGLGHVQGKTLTLFCREAITRDRVSLDEAEEALREAHDMPKTTAKQLEIRQAALQRAKDLMRLAQS